MIAPLSRLILGELAERAATQVAREAVRQTEVAVVLLQRQGRRDINHRLVDLRRQGRRRLIHLRQRRRRLIGLSERERWEGHDGERRDEDPPLDSPAHDPRVAIRVPRRSGRNPRASPVFPYPFSNPLRVV
jgi:hypothetical protein